MKRGLNFVHQEEEGPVRVLAAPGRRGVGAVAMNVAVPPSPDAFLLRALNAADADAAVAVIRTAFSAQRIATNPPSSALRETAETIAFKIATGG